MPEYLDVEPDQLRQIAVQHDRRAADIRKWGEIPHGWLAEFESGYGTIADPMRGALVDYYNRRHDAAERLAAKHERTRDELNAAAKALEDADLSGRSHITNSGDFADTPRRFGPASGTPMDAPPLPGVGPDTPVSEGRPVQPPAIIPSAVEPSAETGRSDHVPLAPAATASQSGDTAPPAATAPTGMAPFPGGISEPGVGDIPPIPVDDASSAAGTPIEPDNVAGMVAGSNDDPSMTGMTGAPLAAAPYAAPLGAGGAGMTGRIGGPLATVPFPAPGPFVAAAHAPKERQALPSFVVGEQVEDDLLLARTLLAATLAAVRDSAPGLEWAAAVGRTPVGPIVLLTSTEGRSWLPPGLFLPSEVALPWRWDFFLNPAVRESMAALEGIADPARILVEFGSTRSRRKRFRISALVSSAEITSNLRTALGDDVALEDWVNAAESAVDLTSPGIGLVDRLALAGSDELREQAAAVPETHIRVKCLELARAAHAGVQVAVSPMDEEIFRRRTRRQRILDAMQAGQPVAASWLDEIRDEHDRTAALLWSRRADISEVPVGVGVNFSSAEELRAMGFERRADELLLLIGNGGADRQTLRDVFYAYAQIVEHPQFPAEARTVAMQSRAVGATALVPGGQFARSAGPSAPDVHPISVSPIGLGGGTPPSVAEILNGPAGPVSSGEQRRA
jgi:hypothetical protein